jgi:conjugative transfer signal peptidase TraF
MIRLAPVLGLSAVAACGVLLGVTLRAAGVRVNLSPSAPLGVFLASPLPSGHGAELHRGMLVAVCLPHAMAQVGRARGYLMRGSCADGTAPVGKTILALSGDTVVVSGEGVAVGSGRPLCRTRPLGRDAAARPIPRIPDGRYAVAAGEIWLISTYTVRSWDSRYFGPVPAAGVVATLRPLWTIETRRPESDTTRGQRLAAAC